MTVYDYGHAVQHAVAQRSRVPVHLHAAFLDQSIRFAAGTIAAVGDEFVQALAHIFLHGAHPPEICRFEMFNNNIVPQRRLMDKFTFVV